MLTDLLLRAAIDERRIAVRPWENPHSLLVFCGWLEVLDQPQNVEKNQIGLFLIINPSPAVSLISPWF
jgi:hypothetical protein